MNVSNDPVFIEEVAPRRRARRVGLARGVAAALAAAALLWGLTAAPARAATITVANGAVAVANNNVCSLIEAIENAEDTGTGRVHDDCVAGNPSGADTIQLPVNGSFNVTAPYPFAFSDNGLPAVFTEITIEGRGSTIQRDQGAATPLFRFFESGGVLTLNDLTLTGGSLDWGGGAINNYGALTVNRCRLIGNSGDGGGAIGASGTSPVTIRDSTFSDNRTFGNSGGGAIINTSLGALTIEGSAFSFNSTARRGGAILHYAGGPLIVRNSTFFSNGSGLTGGAIHNWGAATLINVTMRLNDSDQGGGIYNESLGGDTATLTLTRSLVADNAGFSGGPNVANAGVVVANAYNLFGHSGAADVSGFAPGATDLVPAEAVDAILAAAPANNGGRTENFALVAGSPAIDAAPSADCAAPPANVDQRGRPRGADGDGSPSANECDIGAYEAQGASANPTLYVSPAVAGNVSGIAAKPQDILAHDLGADSWAMHFDGSDVGVNRVLSAFAHLPDGDLLLSFKTNQSIPGVGVFTPWDVARFTPSQLGPTTAGAFSWYFDGSDVGLTTVAEKIDALDALPDGQLLISTMGGLAAPQPGGGVLKAQDEDLVAFTPTATGATTAGTWAPYFDGTAVAGLKAEDVVGAHADAATGDLYLSILGGFNVGGVGGNGKDVLKLTPSGGGYTVTRFWRGPQHGFNLNLGGIEIE
jgi:hypothetical protein